jgi:thiamine-phosphate pyrophosphorylase
VTALSLAAGRILRARAGTNVERSDCFVMTTLDAARFYAILDTAYVPRARWRATCAALTAGGADLVQVRAKRETPAEREALLLEVLPLFGGGSTRRPHLIVNDDVDLAARHEGVGLHIGQDDTAPAEARERLGPGKMLGLSTHSWEQARAALALPTGVLDYFCVGPVFATQTKPDYVPVGLDLVHRVAEAKPRLPWFAIGGITRRNISEVASAGAHRVVVVSDVLLADDPSAAIREARAQLQRGFETTDR